MDHPPDLLARRRYLLSQARLYGILDTGYVRFAEMERVTTELIAGGCDLIQLRAKDHSEVGLLTLARRIRTLFEGTDVLFIINDSPKVARIIEADGVHIGQDDLSVPIVRGMLAENQLIGLSTHSLAQAEAAVSLAPDYIGVGPLYATPTKPDYLPVGLSLIRQVREKVTLPQFCIGGIKRENLPEVLAAGAERVVIVSGMLQAKDIVSYAREVKSLIGAKGLLA